MYIAMDMKSRKYDMGTRQQAKTATRDAIIQAAIDTFMAERSFAITLPAVAERAEVTVKTVLRHFGSREALIDAAWSHGVGRRHGRRTAPRPMTPTPHYAFSSPTTSAEARWCSPCSPTRTTPALGR